MIFGLADRVQETTTTVGTGTLTLAGATTGFRTFSAALDSGSPVSYVITFGADWETGIGIFTESNVLSRETVLTSSNAGALVNFSAGTKTVFISRVAAFQDAVVLIAGEALSAHDAVYLRVLDQDDEEGLFEYGQVYRTDAKDALSSTQCMFLGFATHAASAAGKPVLVKTGGTLSGISGVAKGYQYYLSNTPGGITVTGTLANRRLVGVGVETGVLLININTQPTPFAMDVSQSSLGTLGPGIYSAGSVSSGASARSSLVEYVDTYSLFGNAGSRGSVGLAVSSYGVAHSADDVFLSGGVRGTTTPVVESAVQVGDRFVSSGSIADTGDMTVARFGLSASSNSSTNGFLAGGSTGSGVSNVIDVIVFASFTTTTSDCGDLTVARSYLAGASSGTPVVNTGVFAGGFNTTFQSVIDKIVLATATQNATDRGDLLVRKQSLTGLDSTYCTFAGGFNGMYLAELESVDLWTYSVVAMDRGELTIARGGLGSTGATILAGGSNGVELNIIEQVDSVSVAVNVLDRGDLLFARYALSGD